jgi:hypothetical protein
VEYRARSASYHDDLGLCSIVGGDSLDCLFHQSGAASLRGSTMEEEVIIRGF